MMKRSVGFAAACCLGWGVHSGAVVAAEFWVTSNADGGPGSLRAILAAVDTAAGDEHTIRFDVPVAGPIVLQSPLPAISKPVVTISAFKAPAPVIIDGGGQFSIFTALGSVRTLRVSWLTMRNGLREDAVGGGCLQAMTTADSPGELALIGVRFQGCRAHRVGALVAGGALLSLNQHVTIDQCVFENNTVVGSGGAISLDGIAPEAPTGVVIRASSFIGNRARGAVEPVRGGAVSIWSADTRISGSRFIDNATVDIDDDQAPMGSGAAVNLLNRSRLRLDDSVFLRNRSDYAAIFQGAGWVDAVSHVRNSSFVANAVGAGSVLTLATYRLDVRNNTFLEAEATGTMRPLLVYHSAGSGIPGPSPVTYVHNNVFGPGNHSTQELCARSGVVAGSVADNVAAADNPGCGMTRNASLVDLAVEALLDDGGSIETVTVFADSVAIDTGNADTPDDAPGAACMPVDARGFARVRDGDTDGTARCDIGPWESQDEASLFRDRFDPVLWRPGA